MGYQNINSFRNKINVREMIVRLQLDYFVISETKLDSSFPFSQFHLGDYELWNCKDRNKSQGGLIEFAIFLSKAVNKFDNLIIMDDFNLDITKED